MRGELDGGGAPLSDGICLWQPGEKSAEGQHGTLRVRVVGRDPQPAEVLWLHLKKVFGPCRPVRGDGVRGRRTRSDRAKHPSHKPRRGRGTGQSCSRSPLRYAIKQREHSRCGGLRMLVKPARQLLDRDRVRPSERRSDSRSARCVTASAKNSAYMLLTRSPGPARTSSTARLESDTSRSTSRVSSSGNSSRGASTGPSSARPSTAACSSPSTGPGSGRCSHDRTATTGANAVDRTSSNGLSTLASEPHRSHVVTTRPGASTRTASGCSRSSSTRQTGDSFRPPQRQSHRRTTRDEISGQSSQDHRRLDCRRTEAGR